MTAFIFNPSNEYIGKFRVDRLEELATDAERFSAQHKVPDYSYVELEANRWTIIGQNPFQLVPGVITNLEEGAGAASDSEIRGGTETQLEEIEEPPSIRKTVHELRFFAALGTAFLLLGWFLYMAHSGGEPFSVSAGPLILWLICVGQIALYFDAAYYLRNRKPGGKALGIISAILALPAIPIGTIAGFVWIVRLNTREAGIWLGKAPSQTR